MYSFSSLADFVCLRSSEGRKKGAQFFSQSAQPVSRIVRMFKSWEKGREKGRKMYIARFQSERSCAMLKIITGSAS
jgi:hypothetical protein